MIKLYLLILLTVSQGLRVDMDLDKYYRGYPSEAECNGSIILKGGIHSRSQLWEECMGIPSTGIESTLNSFWRVYTCVLSKCVTKGQETISLKEFAHINTQLYPNQIRQSINDAINDILSNTENNETETWLKAGALLTDYKSIDKIRAQYYDIEQEVCGSELKISNGNYVKHWNVCSWKLEYLLRYGTCCGNYTIPFRDFKTSKVNCGRIIKRIFSKIDTKEYEVQIPEYLFLHFDLACYLIDKSIITIDDLLKIKRFDNPPINIIIKTFYSYLPKKDQIILENKFNLKYNGTDVNGTMYFMEDRQFSHKQKDLLYSSESLNFIKRNIEYYNLDCNE